jgi:phosphotransferase system  glucose/maltose/N-acetylglucosamine-specific IIC component
MTTAWGQVLSGKKSDGDGFCYLLAAVSGALAGWVDIKVGDLLLTALVVLAANMLLGFLSPRRPWRWVLLVGAFVPVVEWLAYFFLTQKPERA